MADFLTENAMFKCACAMQPLFFTCREKNNSNVTFRGEKVLTTGAELQKPAGLQCAFLTANVPPVGVSKPCKLQQTVWQNFDEKTSAQSSNLLTGQSKNFCAITPAGIIEVVVSGVSGNFRQGN